MRPSICPGLGAEPDLSHSSQIDGVEPGASREQRIILSQGRAPSALAVWRRRGDSLAAAPGLLCGFPIPRIGRGATTWIADMSASSSDGRIALVAVATDAAGRAVFVSLDGHEFAGVAHFPLSLEEAEDLAARPSGRCLIREELVARYCGRVALVEITEAGHGRTVAIADAEVAIRKVATASPLPDSEAQAATGEASRHPAPAPTQGVVIGRRCNEQLTIRCDQGGIVSVRVQSRLGERLDIGQRALVVFDRHGAPVSARPIEGLV